MTVRVEHLLRALREHRDFTGVGLRQLADLAEQYAKEERELQPSPADSIEVPRVVLERLVWCWDEEAFDELGEKVDELRALLEGK